MILDAVGLIAHVENLKNKWLAPNVNQQFTIDVAAKAILAINNVNLILSTISLQTESFSNHSPHF